MDKANQEKGQGLVSGAVTLEKNVYELKDFNAGVPSQQICFYRLNPDGTSENGTTLEEMLNVSIERLNQLNRRFPCRENSVAITKMEEALMWLDKRTKDRKLRGVEGTHQI
jgi:hypothetical protein